MILWLASYPKSGNTWVRAFLSNYFLKKTTNILDNIYNIENFPREKMFEGIVDKELLKKDRYELFKYFIPAQKKINENNKLNILKTHNFAGSINDYPFTDTNNTCGAIYIIRDPRSVAVSYAYHTNISFEKSVDHLLNDNHTGINDKLYIEARLSWSIHAQSWINSNWPKVIIRYEDLHNDTFKNFKQILLFIKKFSNFEMDDEKIKKTIHVCSFKNLLNEEKEKGFLEKLDNINFFRKGEIDEWKNILPKNLIQKIEKKFEKQMKELGYL